MPLLSRRAFLAAVGLCVPAGSAALAGSDDRRGGKRDHEGARRAFQKGEIRSLSELLAELRSRLGGDVIEVELKTKGGIYVYEFKVLTSSGRVNEVKVNAATGEVIESE